MVTTIRLSNDGGFGAPPSAQSENPTSPHYADQTRLFSQEQWLPMRFSESAIKADPDYSRRVVSGRR